MIKPVVQKRIQRVSHGWGSSNWLKGWLEPRMNQTAFTKNTLFILTWDEALTISPTNQIYTVIFGDVIEAEGSNRSGDTPYNYYSLLRSIEDNISYSIELLISWRSFHTYSILLVGSWYPRPQWFYCWAYLQIQSVKHTLCRHVFSPHPVQAPWQTRECSKRVCANSDRVCDFRANRCSWTRVSLSFLSCRHLVPLTTILLFPSCTYFLKTFGRFDRPFVHKLKAAKHNYL